VHGSPPPVVGLTGGIASGKSTVSAQLASLGAYIIDADRVGHQVLAPGGEAYDAVVSAFGREIVAADGTIDRRKLGAKVFADPGELKRLNGISHPRMAQRVAAEIAQVRARAAAERPPLIVLDAAILFEAGWDRLCDRVWTVEAAPDLALARLVSRNGLTREQAQARLNAQWTNAERAKRSQRVIANGGTVDELNAAVARLWQETVAGHAEAS
jgi:dephospho-CoA kinase